MSTPWRSKCKTLKPNEQLYLPVMERTYWDDDPIHYNERVKMVFRGQMRKLAIRNIQKGVPWEMFCRSVTMLSEFYSHEGTQLAFRDGLIESSHICATLSEHPKRKEVLNSGMDVGMITGIVYVPYLVAWCSLCRLAGAEQFDCTQMWSDDPAAVEIIKMCFVSFDKLRNIVYTDKQVFGVAENHYRKNGNG